MEDPRLHLMVDAERRADLIRQARRRELAERIAAARDAERRSLLERLHLLRRQREAPAAADAPAVPEL